ncbi:MAG TPA: SulP family inorganic anion transporter [bacterium]|nr:SulP family inorganic anion transporter [bacterium]
MFIPKSIICLRDYSWKQFRSDLAAGIVVGLVALPLAMAFSIACGLPPERGLYTAVVAGFLISALSGSRVAIGGPTGAFIVIVAGIVAKYGYSGLAMATGMAGLILIVMGLARMGTLVKYIPYPVITGFTSGIAVVIFSTQVKDFFGLRMTSVPADFLEKWTAFAAAFPTLNPFAVGLGLFTILCVFLWPRQWKVPGSVVALGATSLAAAWGHWPVETIGTRFGGIPQGLPHPQFVFDSWAQAKALLPSAFTVAALAAIESLLCAVVADGMIGSRHKSNMELVAQGVANCLSPVFGGIPATGAIARTATNVRNGGRTPMAGMIHAVVLFLILLSAGPLAAHIPLAALAGILVVVCYHMSEWHSFKFILTGPSTDILVLLTTFLLTVFVDLTVAVGVGMVLAAFLFMRNVAALGQVKALTHENEAERSEEFPAPPGVEVYAVNGSFSFGAAERMMDVEQSLFKAPKALVLDMAGVFYMDATGLKTVRDIRQRCQSRGTRLLLAGVQSQPYEVLTKAKKVEKIGRENFKPSLRKALEDLAAHPA